MITPGHFSLVISKRPGLNACLLEELQQGAVLLVLRLDRLSHSMPHLVTLVEELRDQGIGFRSIGDGAIDTTTADGELVFLILLRLVSRATQGRFLARRGLAKRDQDSRINTGSPTRNR